MDLFKRKIRLGMIINNENIQLVCLEKARDGFILAAAREISISQGIVSGGVVMQIEPVAQAIRELWVQTGIDKREISLGIINQSLLIKLIDFPRLPKNKIAQALRWQAGNYMPVPTEDWSYDFDTINENWTQKGDLTQVLLAAVKNDLLESSLQAVQKAGLTVGRVEPIPLSLLHLVPQEWRWTNFLLADISRDMTTLMFTQRGVPSLFRILPQSFVDPEAFREAVNIFLADQDSPPEINVLLLKGQDIGLADLSQYIQEKTSIKTMVLDPSLFLLTSTKNPPVSKADVQIHGLNYAAAISIAM